MAPLKLLVVEDDLPSLELMTEVLTSLKADVRPVSASQDAADLANRQKFDGIFLDLEMPSLHGLDLARTIRQSSWNKSTPIIVVTGRTDPEAMQQAFSVGATFFLQKPIDRQKLTGLFRTVRGSLFENRRRAIRIPLQTDVDCTVRERTLHGKTWNISQGGMQVEASSLQPGDAVHLSFRLPSSTIMIDAIGVVMWTKEERQGIQFTKLSGQDEKAVRDFVASIEKPDWL